MLIRLHLRPLNSEGINNNRDMPTRIRLQRKGKKGQPYYHIVVADQRSPRDGKYIDRIGAYDPNQNPAFIEIDREKCLSWLQKGASPSDTCRAIPPATALTCEAPVCSDGRDDDADGRTDYPADPGCATPADASEDDACPAGPGCPVCADGLDNDGDGAIDYPADSSCAAASSPSELTCGAETDPLLAVTTPTTTGTTAGAANNFAPTCAGAMTGTAPDRVYLLTLQVPVASLTADTTGAAYDTVLSLTPAACAPVLACDDDAGPGNTSLFTRTNLAAGTYALIVDGFGAGAGAYTLNVRGTLPAGGSCADPLVGAGVLTCPTGSTCQAGTCAP